MRKMLAVLFFAVVVIIVGSNAQAGMLDWRVSGYAEVSAYPLNNEHNSYGTLEVYSEFQPKDFKKGFLFIQPVIFLGGTVPKIRYDNRYITGVKLGVGYIQSIKLGIGYELTERLDMRAVYWNTREYTGYEGDWTGIQIRYTFGESRR